MMDSLKIAKLKGLHVRLSKDLQLQTTTSVYAKNYFVIIWGRTVFKMATTVSMSSVFCGFGCIMMVMSRRSPVHGMLMLVYILIAAFTILNMLIGILLKA